MDFLLAPGRLKSTPWSVPLIDRCQVLAVTALPGLSVFSRLAAAPALSLREKFVARELATETIFVLILT
ncbi:MAG: hypothetical protein F9K44_04515 [Hyphomicrobiaceae bacterium]|nr:MAG: hypothetical protein F9K44_04515 [Hyphomicrobiaceae bacterium]